VCVASLMWEISIEYTKCNSSHTYVTQIIQIYNVCVSVCVCVHDVPKAHRGGAYTSVENLSPHNGLQPSNDQDVTVPGVNISQPGSPRV
jgi:hypothetical protein